MNGIVTHSRLIGAKGSPVGAAEQPVTPADPRSSGRTMSARGSHLVDVYTMIVYTASMLKNITLSAEEDLIARAREEAERRGTTLNAEFRLWLAAFTEQERTARGYNELMHRLAYARADRHFSREELNER
jgi:hypothetical protein